MEQMFFNENFKLAYNESNYDFFHKYVTVFCSFPSPTADILY